MTPQTSSLGDCRLEVPDSLDSFETMLEQFKPGSMSQDKWIRPRDYMQLLCDLAGLTLVGVKVRQQNWVRQAVAEVKKMCCHRDACVSHVQYNSQEDEAV
jgi:hypothetical protein